MEWVPSEAKIQAQSRAGAIVVLDKRAADSAAPLGIFAAALNKTVDHAEQQIAAGITAIARTAEAEVSILPVGIDQVALQLHEVTTHGNLMTPDDPVETITECEILTIEGARMSGREAVVARHG